MSERSPRPLLRLVGVYDADHTVRGEVAYWIGARLGRRHCSLCEITHGSLRQRPEWKACRAGLPVPFDTYHRDDQPQAAREAAAGRAPVVLAETAEGMEVIVGPDELEACNGSLDALLDVIGRALADRGLGWPAP